MSAHADADGFAVAAERCGIEASVGSFLTACCSSCSSDIAKSMEECGPADRRPRCHWPGHFDSIRYAQRAELLVPTRASCVIPIATALKISRRDAGTMTTESDAMAEFARRRLQEDLLTASAAPQVRLPDDPRGIAYVLNAALVRRFDAARYATTSLAS